MKKIFLIVLLILLINISFARRRSISNDQSVVDTELGSLKGIVKDTHRVFYGVPFAKPPIDKLRWEDPRDIEPWNSVKDATVQKPGCPQRCNLGEHACPASISEDCLYLDIFTPVDANKNSNYPVIVYITGGAFTVGAGSVTLYDGTKIAQSKVVLVNLNYRLGTLGFMGTDLMHGNYGFLDQVKALEWVNKHISAFGGNKNKVTIWGESAGAFSVAAHLTSEISRTYYHAAISFSSPLTVGLKDKQTARGFATRFATKLNCNVEDITCLRSKTIDQILEAQSQVALQLFDRLLDAFTIWSPVIDGVIIERQPLVAAKENKAYDVPLIIGNVENEADLFVYMFLAKLLKPVDYKGLLFGIFPLQYSKILAQYPAPGIGQDSRPILSELLTDYLFRCQDRYYLNRFVQNHKSPVYHYIYKHPKSSGHSNEVCDGKVCHGSELSLFFNSYSLMGEDLNQEEKELAIDLNNFICNFATNHDPNIGLPVPDWDPVTKTHNSTLIITLDPTNKDVTTNDPKCDALDKTYYRNQVRP